MQKHISFFLTFFFVTFFFLFSLPSRSFSQKLIFEEQVIASIEGEPIVMGDLEVFAKEQGLKIKSQDRKRRVLQDYIAVELLKKEAEKEGITVGDEEVERYIDGVAGQNSLTRKEFEKAIIKEGLTLERYKQQAKQDIIRTRILSLRVRSKINVLDEDVRKYLKKNKQSLPKKGQLHLYQVSLRGEGAVDRLVAIRNQVKAGVSLKEAAGELFSDLSYVDPSDLKEDLREELEDLEIGGLTKIITTAETYSFIQLHARVKKNGEIPEDLKDRVADRLFQEQYQQRLEKYLKDELPKSYHVEINL